MKKKQLLLVPIALLGAGFVVLGALNPENVAQTQPDHADSRLRTRHYKTTLAQAYQEVLNIIPELRTYGKSWRVISHEENEIHAEVPVLMFTDDIVVTLKEESQESKEERSVVTLNVRSASRVGKSDLGENRRHVLQLLAALDAKLPS